MSMTRRTAIISSLWALGGQPIYAGQKTDSTWLNTTGMMSPIGISVSLDTITYLEVRRGKETVRITADEIWSALHPEAAVTTKQYVDEVP